jgi:hypothetical protein
VVNDLLKTDGVFVDVVLHLDRDGEAIDPGVSVRALEVVERVLGFRAVAQAPAGLHRAYGAFNHDIEGDGFTEHHRLHVGNAGGDSVRRSRPRRHQAGDSEQAEELRQRAHYIKGQS